MATAKKAAEENNEVKADFTGETGEWAEEVTIHVPRKPKGEDPFYYVCVNDRRYQVPANGKMQTMPKPIAEILQGSVAAEGEADDFIDRLPNNATPI